MPLSVIIFNYKKDEKYKTHFYCIVLQLFFSSESNRAGLKTVNYSFMNSLRNQYVKFSTLQEMILTGIFNLECLEQLLPLQSTINSLVNVKDTLNNLY